jgi:hypothetical protein
LKQREAPLKQREASSKHREASLKQREASLKQRETLKLGKHMIIIKNLPCFALTALGMVAAAL